MKIFMCVDAFHDEEGYGIIKRGFEALGHEVYFYGVMFHLAETFKDSKNKTADINIDIFNKIKEFNFNFSVLTFAIYILPFDF